MKDKKNILIGVLIALVFAMGSGYAALATTFNINGQADITGSWAVEIIGITPETTGTATNDSTTTKFTATTATFGAKLVKPGDSIVYEIQVKNKGNIDAKLNEITLTPQATPDDATPDTGSSAIIYEVVSSPAKNTVLAAGETTTIKVKITFDSNATSIPAEKTRTFTGVFEYVQNN